VSAVIAMQHLQLVIPAIRARRKEIGAEEKLFLPVKIASNEMSSTLLEGQTEIIQKLARVSELEFVAPADREPGGKFANLAWQAFGDFDIFVDYEQKIDVAADRERMTKELVKLDKDIANGERQLNNPGFTGKAPAHVVEGLKKQVDENRKLRDKLRGDLDALPPG
jgi:valyl-tRNA synthetase